MAEMPRSISPVSRTPIGVSSTPNDGASAWMTPNCPLPAAMAGSRRTATRVTRGAISLMKFPAHAVFVEGKTGDVAARPRETIDKAGAHRIGDIHEHNRHAASGLLQRRYSRAASGEDEIRGESDQFRCVLPRLDVACCPAGLDLHIVTASPTQLLEALPKCGDASLPFRIIRGE